MLITTPGSIIIDHSPKTIAGGVSLLLATEAPLLRDHLSPGPSRCFRRLAEPCPISFSALFREYIPPERCPLWRAATELTTCLPSLIGYPTYDRSTGSTTFKIALCDPTSDRKTNDTILDNDVPCIWP